MEVTFRHRVEYAVREAVPVQEVIDTLLANQRLSADLGDLIEGLIEGVQVEKVELRVDEIAFSSLREIFFVAIFYTYQEDLKREIPAMVEMWLGLPVDDRYDTLLTVCVSVLLFMVRTMPTSGSPITRDRRRSEPRSTTL